jgi:hypothetical protein
MLKDIGDLDSVAIVGFKSLIAKTRRSHLLIYIVALVISITVIDSLATINTKPLIEFANLQCTSSTYRSACEGSLRVRSGIRGAERVGQAWQTTTNYHTSQGDNDDTSHNISSQ